LQEVNKEREAKLGVCLEGEGDDRSGAAMAKLWRWCLPFFAEKRERENWRRR
jgi:hypothetical protein